MKKLCRHIILLSSLFGFQFFAHGQNSQKVLTDGLSFHGGIGRTDRPSAPLLSSIPQKQIIAECTFFGGDTLNGFDLVKEASYMGSNAIYFEFQSYILKKEEDFVKKKFNIALLPNEIRRNAQKVIVPVIINNACANLDMESGDFSSWSGTHGYNVNSNAPFTVVNSGITYNTDGSHTDCSYYELITASYGNDFFGGFPGVAPGGNFSARIGSEGINEGKTRWCNDPDQDVAHTSAEEIHQTYVVSAANALLTYQYAVILNDATNSGTPHPFGAQPYFEAVVQDNVGNVLSTCTDYYQQVLSGVVPTGYTLSASGNGIDGTEVYYLPWTSNTVNLTPYIGQTVTVKFIASGCIFAGHFAYAYVEATCGPVDIVISPANPCAGGTAVFTAPTVAGGSYSWIGPGILGTATSQSVTVNVTGTYSVTITPVQGPGCAYTLSVPITFNSPSFSGTASTPTDCTSPTGTATANVTGGIGSYTYLWGPGGQTTQVATGLATGNYTITVTDGNGCSSVATQSVSPYPPVVADYSVTTVCLGNSSQFTDLSNAAATSWSWNFGDGNTTTQQSPSHTYTASGTFSTTLTSTGAGGCNSSVTHVVTVNPQPVANFSVTTVCLGNPTQFTDQSTGGGTQWDWDFGDGNISSQQSPSNTYTAAGTYTATLISTGPGGCNSTMSQQVTVNPLSVANFATTDICINTNPASFQDQSTGASLWTWNFGDGTPNSASQSPIHIYGAPGTYSVSLLVESAGGCKDSIVHTINVNPVPDATFISSIVCFNNATLFTDQSLGVPSQWHWDFGDGTQDSVQNPSHTYGTSGTFTVTLIATNSLGCSDTLPLTAIVNPIPVANFTAPGVCIGNVTCFQDQSTIASGVIVGWSWNFNDPTSGASNISNIQHPCHVFAAVGTYNVILTVTSGTGCQNTINMPVTVTLPPVAAFSATSVCLNSPTVFSDSSTGSPIQWYWNFGDGSTSTLQNPSHVYLGYGTYVVTLTAYSGSACSDTVTDTVMVSPLPIVLFKSDSVCVGKTTSFTDASFMPVGNIVGWSWNFGDPVSGVDNTSGLQNPTHIFSSAGTYSVTLTDTSATGCVSSKTFTAIVFPGPDAAFSYSPSSPVNITDMVSFTDQTSGSPVQWWWDFGDNDTSIQQNPEHLYPEMGSYTITLIATTQNGCTDTTYKPLEILQFAFYIPNAFTPNGNGNNDFFFGKGVGIVEYEMHIFDRWGNRIFYCKINDLPQTLPCMWDGKVEAGTSNEPVQEDVYVWKVRLLDIFGETHKYIGTVTVVR